MKSNREVARLWAKGEGLKASSNSMFCEHDIIYSYSRHFPIAQIIKECKVVHFNSDTYSRSTTKHQSIVRGMIPLEYSVIAGNTEWLKKVTGR